MARSPETSPKHLNKRKEIINASAQVFERVGYHRASMQMLAEEVGLGKPTLYHYFKSKNEILYAIHQETISHVMVQHESRIAKSQKPEELLRGMAVDMMVFIKKYPGYVRAFFEHVDELEPQHKNEIRTQRHLYMSEAVKAIKVGIDNGTFKKCNARIAALSFFGMLNWSYKWLHNEKRTSASALANSMCDLFLGGLKT